MLQENYDKIKYGVRFMVNFFFFFLEFQPIASTFDDSSLSSDQDTNQFLV